MKYFILIFTTCLFTQLSAQLSDPHHYYRWYVDKPTTQQDSLNLVKASISKLKIYKYDRKVPLLDSNDVRWDTSILAIWSFNYRDGKITATLQRLSDNEDAYGSLYKSTDKLKRSKNTITERVGNKRLEFELTHFLNDSGQVIKTLNTTINSDFENRYELFGRIDYVYKNGFLSEALYVGDGNLIAENHVYLKYVFEYLK